MIRLALFGNKSQSSRHDLLGILISSLLDRPGDFSLTVDRRYMQFLNRTIGLPFDAMPTFDIYDGMADLVLSIGGDGSFLTTASAVGAYETPIMGINSGHLGYLSAAELSDTSRIIHEILSGDYDISERTVIAVTTSDPQLRLTRSFALNEVAFLKRDTASMITLDTSLNGAPLARYRADGLIVSTPTGSTGYNLSIGGPIVAPDNDDWIIAPIAPHSLSMRPLVVSDRSTLDVAVSSRSDSFMVSVDGKATALPIDTRLRLEKAGFRVNVVMERGHNFTDTLRDKLLWGAEGN